MNSLDINAVLQHLPHRYPFLLIDRVLDYEVGDYLIAIKNVSFNEPFFQGHFPIRPIMPGVLLLEAMAQATGILSFKTAELQPDSKSLYFLTSIDKARFKKQVVPGDQLMLEAVFIKSRRNIWSFECRAEVDGVLAASANIMCAAVVG